MPNRFLVSAAAGFLIGGAVFPTFNPAMMMAGIALWLSVATPFSEKTNAVE